ncbi:MAG: His/Gly/Thr/Pro-type tRNA ligase C-terminal domain-containing protein [Candidatus Paceibacterota bacterium]|jgi:histidyl-tRNA synthetase
MKKDKKAEKKLKKEKDSSKFIEFLPINKNSEAVIYYGFTPIKNLQISKEDINKVSPLKDSFSKNNDLSWIFSQTFAEERASLIRWYIENEMSSQSQPIMLMHESTNIKERAKDTINLEVMGTEKSIAEALLIKTTLSILKDNGYKDFSIEINTIGDKESVNKFSKELVNYFKKNLNSLPAHCRQNFKKDPFYVLSCEECDCAKIKDASPTSISCLSDESRLHFKEILEYIETMEIPYKINNCLVPDKKYCFGTIYKIKDASNEEILAVGFRNDGFAQKIGNKKDIPCAGIKIFLKKKATIKKISKITKPIAFYIQLGDEAKHKSLDVIETLKKEKVFVHHMLGRDKFGSQFALVEKTKVPYVIIMGKKESLENSVMVRENSTRTQKTIPIKDLAEYIKKLSE